MDQDNPTQLQTSEGNPNSEAAAVTATSATPSDTSALATDSSTGQHAVPARPRRPQRTARVEGSVDISELKAEPKAESTALPNQEECDPDGNVASHSKPSHPSAVKLSEEYTGPGIKAGPKGPGHHPVRAASVPHPSASRHVPHHLNPHAQRALSVAGTADTQAQTVEDFRQVSCVCVCLSEHASAGPVLPRQLRQINCGTHHIYLYSLIVTLEGCNYSKHEAKVWQVFAE